MEHRPRDPVEGADISAAQANQTRVRQPQVLSQTNHAAKANREERVQVQGPRLPQDCAQISRQVS